MFSLFQQPPEDTSPDPKTSEETQQRWRAIAQRLRTLGGPVADRLRASVADAGHWNRFSVILAIALVVALVFAFHERRVAARLQAQPGVTAARALPPGQGGQLPAQPRSPGEERLAAQISALNAKLDSLTHAQPPAQPAGQAVVKPVPAKPAATHAQPRRSEVSDVTVIHRVPVPRKPDPRWQKVQDQLEAQGRQIDTQGKQLEATRQAIASARTDLQGSIAKTHEELVVLQRKGERNYYEFSIDKSKSFRTVGPVGVSLRKANTKDQYADLKLIMDDREVSKKHLNLYEPVIFYPSGERQPVELVINSIDKNHIRGYISAAKYRASDLQIGTTTASPPAASAADTSVPRHKLVASPR
jgi:hypothetical protein